MKHMVYSCIIVLCLMSIKLWAKNLALELDGKTAIEVPNSDSLNPKK